MILYHPKLGTELERYGINLPLRDDRSSRVFEILQSQFPQLKPYDLKKLQPLSKADLARVHDHDFLERWFDDAGFELEMLQTYDYREEPQKLLDKKAEPIHGLRESILLQVSAVYEGLLQALEKKFCFYLGGGMHHARRDYGSGFCPVNDIVIALRKAQSEGHIKRALIIDTDAHQGDGVAEVTQGDDTLKTLSIHMAKGWPLDGELPKVSSDLDIGIARGGESEYLSLLEQGLKNFSDENFDAVVVVAGADPYEKDELKSAEELKLSKEQMLARDILVYKWCQNKGLPQLWLMAGGYGEEAPSIYGQFILKVLHLVGEDSF